MTPARTAQLAAVHRSTRENNPAKRADVRAKISASLRRNHPSKLHPEIWQRQGRYIQSLVVPLVSKLESVIADRLPDYKPQYKIGFYTVDFAKPALKIVVQVNGCYWHSCQRCFPSSPTTKAQKHNEHRDRARNTYLRRQGWQVIELWEHAIRRSLRREK